MIFHFISVYLFFTILFTSYLAIYSFVRRRSVIISVLFVFSFFLSVYLLGYLLELNSTSKESMIFWNQVQYLTLPFLPGLWLLLALFYTKRVKKINLKVFSLIFLIPIITFILRFTNENHSLYYEALEVVIRSDQPILYLSKGPWYYIQGLYITLAIVLVFLLYSKELSRRQAIRGEQYRVMMLSSMLPLIGYFFIIQDLGGLGIDFGALFLPLSLYLVLFAVLRYDFLNIKNLAREKIFEKSLDAYFIIDEDSNLIDYNFLASQIVKDMGFRKPEEINKAALNSFQDKQKKDFIVSRGGENRHYQIKRVEIFNRFKTLSGMIIQLGDVTEQKQYEEALRISEEKYRLLTEKMSDLLWVWDLSSKKMRFVSSSVTNFCGYEVEEFLNKSLKELLTTSSYQELKSKISQRLIGFRKGEDKDFTDEIEQVCKNGEIIFTEIKSRFIYNKSLEIIEYMGVSRNITAQKEAQKQLIEMATIDSLTNLYNRRHFMDLAQKEFQRSQRSGNVFSLMVMDIDNFKNINDQYGHGGGDEVLQNLGQKMKSFFRSSDIIGRIGGEEFAVILVDTSLDAAYSVAEQFRKKIKQNFVAFKGEKIFYTLSIGLLAYQNALISFDRMMQLADQGLYQAKRAGKDLTVKQEII